MNEVLLSLRIPESLARELAALIKQKHFMDLSDEVRSIIRDQWIISQDPLRGEIQELKRTLTTRLGEKKQQELMADVNRLREELREYFND
ncbi:hypothetical protein J4475_03610 [Candidatus Woesearchaeota archaeon]|nr:hypothetical protein [Candidatus Woesearchaeota archaeon]